MNDECMRLTKEDRCLYENLSAWSASWHANDSMPDPFNSNACLSDFSLSMSSCAGSYDAFSFVAACGASVLICYLQQVEHEKDD